MTFASTQNSEPAWYRHYHHVSMLIEQSNAGGGLLLIDEADAYLEQLKNEFPAEYSEVAQMLAHRFGPHQGK